MRRRGSALVSFGLMAVIVYLVVNTIGGRHGLMSHMELQQRERALQAELATLEARRAVLAAEVVRLSPASLEWDYVEERARRLLHLARPDEILVPVGAGV